MRDKAKAGRAEPGQRMGEMGGEGKANLGGAYRAKGLRNEEGDARDSSLGLPWKNCELVGGSWELGRARQDSQEGSRKGRPCLAASPHINTTQGSSFFLTYLNRSI